MARPPKIPYIERVGMKFNMLTVIGLTGFKQYKNSKKATCLVECDCGKEFELLLDTVTSLKQKSCGCIRKKNQNSAFRDAYVRYQNGAFERGYSFSISEDDFFSITQQQCHYCGVEPLMTRTSYGDTYLYNGIDRKDNGVGYELSNCLPCCSICNRAKSNMSYDDFISWIRRLSVGHIKSD